MADALPTVDDEFSADIRAIQNVMRSAVVVSTAKAKVRYWRVWTEFCAAVGVDPYLFGTSDKISYLQVFLHRYRDGRIAPSGRPVKVGTVSNALTAVGQAFKLAGLADPRKPNTEMHLDLRLRKQLKGYEKLDTPPKRVKPLPIGIVKAILDAGLRLGSSQSRTLGNLVTIAFYFLLRPSEYVGTSYDYQAFTLKDVALYNGQ